MFSLVPLPRKLLYKIRFSTRNYEKWEILRESAFKVVEFAHFKRGVTKRMQAQPLD